MRSRLSLIVAGALLAAGCGGTEVDSTAPGADAPLADPAAVTATLGIDADGCYLFEAAVEGHETYRRTTCSSGYFTAHAEGCLVATAGGNASGDSGLTTVPCDLRLPPFLYGWAPPAIGWLCLADFHAGIIGPVRFLAPGDDGLFVESLGPDTGATPFPYTIDGAYWGEPPLDGPAASVYALCDAAGPWEGPVPHQTNVLMVVRLDPSLVPPPGEPDQVGEDTLGLWIDAGAGPAGFSFGAFQDGAIIDPGVRLLSTSTTLTMAIFDMETGAETDLGSYPLPQPIIDELGSGWLCTDAPMVLIDIGASILTADPDAISIGWLNAAERAALLGWDRPATTRTPGTACPATGVLVEGDRPAGPDLVIEASLLVRAPADLLTGGDPYLMVSSEGSGWMLGSLDLIDPEPLEGGRFAPGALFTVGLGSEEQLDPPGIDLEIPPLPDGLAPP
ncbi:MAG: hypothetical protein MUP76_00760, partial [Acidimicrobiia bacterium]|nr:hypothetical protein [Acidimicrobiia bacterium]